MFLASGLQLLQQQRKWFSQEGKIIWAELLFKKNCLLDVKPGGKMILTASQFALRWALNETPGNDDQKTVWPLTLNRSVTQHTFSWSVTRTFDCDFKIRALNKKLTFVQDGFVTSYLRRNAIISSFLFSLIIVQFTSIKSSDHFSLV